jgi:hypothetical protein
MTLEDLVNFNVIACLEHDLKKKMGLKARKELNERNLKEHVELNKSTTKDLD